MKSNNSLISVIVPVYNAFQYIDRCLDSIVNQTYKQLEIIVIDDGSTDGSSAKCDYWKEQDDRIKVIHIKNSGVSHARNVGLDKASGEFIGFVDSDDWIDIDMYQKMMATMLEDDSQIVVCGYVRENENGTAVGFKKGKRLYLSGEEAIKYAFCCKASGDKLFGWELCDKLFRSELWIECRLNEEITMAEDMLALWDVMNKAAHVSFLPLYGYHYFTRGNSVCNVRSINSLYDGIKAKKLLFLTSRESELSSVCERLYIDASVSFIIKTICFGFYNDQYVKEMIEDCLSYYKSKSIVMLLFDVYRVKTKFGMVLLLVPINYIKKMRHLLSVFNK